MKKTFALSLILLFSSCNLIQEEQVDEKSEYYYYSSNKKKIYYKQTHTYSSMIPLPTGFSKIDMDADANTFEVLSNIIAKDKNDVYFWSAKVKSVDVDAATFYHVKDYIYKDKNHVFKCKNNQFDIIEGADPETYEPFKYPDFYEYPSGLAKDKNGYFFSYKRVDISNPSKFEVLSEFAYGGFDDKFVYSFEGSFKKVAIQGKLIKVDKNLLYDDAKIYHFTWQGKRDFKTIPIENKKSFTVYDSGKNTVFQLNGKIYWKDYIITDFDIKSFIFIGGNYAKDANGVYFVRNIQNNNVAKIDEADSGSFTYIGNGFAYDKDNVYCGMLTVPKADHRTIQKTKEGLKDKNHEWRFNKNDKEWVIVN